MEYLRLLSRIFASHKMLSESQGAAALLHRYHVTETRPRSKI
jgi:hypothetical protein